MRAVFLFVVLAVLTVVVSPSRAAESVIRPGERVVFLGDSITQDGRFIAWLDLLLRTRASDPLPELINLGLASETVSGLSEPEHPWPRPCLFERLDRALEKAKPHVVIACYGMNDGVYAPPSEERRAAFEQGVLKLSEKVRAAGARLILVTPPPFDAVSFKGKLKEETEDGDFGYGGVWRGYDGVLAGYAKWMLETPNLADQVFDLHTPMREFYDAMRSRDPEWDSGDGIHPNAAGHLVIAGLLAEALELPASPGVILPERDTDGSYRFAVETALPLPAWRAGSPEVLALGRFTENANALKLEAELSDAAYRLKDGDRLLGIFSVAALSENGGVDLTAMAHWSATEGADALYEPMMKRHALMSGAWREHVGHARPDTDRNFPPLEEARRLAAPLEEAMRWGAEKRKATLVLEPVR